MISYFSAFFITAILLAACFFLTRYFITKDQAAWKEKFTKVEKEHRAVEKAVRREEKKVTRLTQQCEDWKEKFEVSEKKYIPMVKELTAEKKALQTEVESLQSAINRLEGEKAQGLNKVEQLQKELTAQKEKYATDLSDSKGWKTSREKLMGEVKDVNTRLTRILRENDELKSRIVLQREKIAEAETIKKTFRKLRTSNKKLQEDLAYWEKKHYDVHHKIVEQNEELEVLKKEKNELKQLHDGNEILRQNLLKKIEEFKTKFVNVNNSYHELLAKHR